MKRTEIVYLLAVTLFALLFARVTMDHAGAAFSRITAAETAVAGAAGKPRDVDLELIRDLIRKRRLSDHEAEFYKEAPAGGAEGPGAPEP